MTHYIFDVSENDALPLEYKLDNRQPLRQVDVTDFINNSPFVSLGCTKEGSFEEQRLDVLNSKIAVTY